jgi:hypothetical protein
VLRICTNVLMLLHIRNDVSKKGFLCRLNSGTGEQEQLKTEFNSE